MTFRATVLTLYPEMFPGSLGVSLAGRALEAVCRLPDDPDEPGDETPNTPHGTPGS